ncbi:hypothetical protein GCM10007071_29450 [Marinobacter zhanjiangensis]|uniref:Uncharacterized protein n=1 Tax=Marinobacter zhanjiangensis TaxID=578215 RepID=A0ABQ3B9Q9_9GAMM|nr:hypothetical protein GCM10007071_29450 [Marinobacter zhanjiangensis]
MPGFPGTRLRPWEKDMNALSGLPLIVNNRKKRCMGKANTRNRFLMVLLTMCRALMSDPVVRLARLSPGLDGSLLFRE